MAILASDVMDGARVLLNDVGATNFTNTVLLPLVKRASKKLEKLLLIYENPGQRMANSSPIDVAANSTSLTLPNDFLLPIKLFERPDGGTDADWIPMSERDWNPENFVATTTIRFWAFRNLIVSLPPCTVAREILLEYERILPVITAANSPIEDTTLIVAYLEAKTAEYAARHIGMNETIAASIRDNEVNTAEDELMRVITLSNQGVRYRRQKFGVKRLTSTSLG